MFKFFKRLFCLHLSTATFVRNIGDDDEFYEANTSLWVCDRCGGLITRDFMYLDE